ncbi:sensor histidine kinase [Sunxiuqinia sp. A32]|uniref:sensor histidine kinase n=1 Tax=Sunxiuqinia sp. A32 TaxID=3461496 RepID=UPI0040467BD0
MLIDYIRKYFLTADTKAYASLYEKKKSILVSFFLYFFLFISLFFVFAAIVTKDYEFLLADSSFFVLGCILIYFLKIKKYLNQVINIFIGLICVISILFVQSGGMNNTGILTAVLVPIPIILLLGKRRGIWTLVIFTAVNLAGFIFLKNESWFPDYNPDWLERVTVVFVMISLMAYINEYVFDQLYFRLETITNSFRTSQERYKNLAINKEKFLSLVSHDLSHHIGNFAVTSNMLNEQYDVMSSEEKRNLITQLASISNQNYHLLQDLLKWSTVQNEIIPFSPQSIKLESILREVIELFDQSIQAKKLSLFIKVNSNSEVFADSDMLGSIIRNILSNAIKYSKENGEIRISAIEKGDFMIVSVTDKGIGMNPQVLQQVKASISFSTPGTLQESGTGIGLILVKEFLQKNKGEFFVESEEGEGTEVSFTLPLAD